MNIDIPGLTPEQCQARADHLRRCPVADLPDDLIDRLARDLDKRHEDWGFTLGFVERAEHRDKVRMVLAALAEWADGSLLDPDGWRRLDAVAAGDDPHDPDPAYYLTPRETTP